MKNKYFTQLSVRLGDLIQDSKDYLVATYSQSMKLFTPGSAWGMILSVVQNISQKIMYYFEDTVTEMNIYTATRDESIKGLIALTGHNPMRSMGAHGEVKITYNGKSHTLPGGYVIIPNGLKLKCEQNSLPYLIDSSASELRLELNSRNPLKSRIIQGEIGIKNFQGSGRNLQSYMISSGSKNYIDQEWVKVFVNGELWKPYVSLYDMSYNTKGYVARTSMISGVDIFFGNEYNGMIPPNGSDIRVEYLLNNGEGGSLSALGLNPTFKFDESGYDIYGNEVDLNEFFVGTTSMKIDFGVNPEPLFLTKLLGPRVSKSMTLGNPTNYITWFEKFNLFSQIEAFTTLSDDNVEDDSVVYLFLIPDARKLLLSGENYFTSPVDNFYLDTEEKKRIYKMIDDSGSKMVNITNVILDPIMKYYVMYVTVNIWEGWEEGLVRTKIVSALSDYMFSIRRRDYLPKSDFIALVEGIDGVDSVSIQFISKDIESQYAAQSVNGTGVGASKITRVANTIDKSKYISPDGDVVIGGAENLVLVRGGWTDRNGVYYEDGISDVKPSSVNIRIGQVIKKTYNTDYNAVNRQKILNANK